MDFNIFKFSKVLFILLFILFQTTFIAKADKGFLDIKTLADIPNVNIECKILEDTTQELSIQNIQSPHVQSLFEPANGNNIISKPNSVYWIKFSIQNNNQQNSLITFVRYHKKVELYIPKDSGQYEIKTAGFNYPYHLRQFPSQNILFEIPHSNNDKIYYARIESSKFKIGLGITSYKYKDFLTYSFKTNYTLGIFVGILIVVIFYSLIFFFFSKEKIYLYYFLYTFSFLAYSFADWGLIANLGLPNNLSFSLDWYTWPFAFMTISLLLYTRSFLDTKKDLPTIDKVLVSLIALRLVLLIAASLSNWSVLYNPNLDNVILAFALVLGIYRLNQGFKPALYFNIALLILFVGLVIHGISFANIYNIKKLANIFSFYNTGIIEIFLFSLALGDRYRNFKKEKEKIKEEIIVQLKENEHLKDKVNRELEQKVAEKTEKIRLQSLEIERMNALLRADNVVLRENVSNLSQARVMQQEVSFEEFQLIYINEESCYDFLINIKWENGFKCKKCGNEKFSTLSGQNSRKCSKCSSIESATANTIFHKLRFPIIKAFYLLFLISSGKEYSSEELSKLVDLRAATCWSFRKKIQEVMLQKKFLKKHKNDGWKELILVDESPLVTEK